jgi:hypothetical protein
MVPCYAKRVPLGQNRITQRITGQGRVLFGLYSPKCGASAMPARQTTRAIDSNQVSGILPPGVLPGDACHSRWQLAQYFGRLANVIAHG